MFGRTYRLPIRLLGIPLHLDVSFLIVLPILAWVIAQNIPGFIETFALDIDPGPLQEGRQELLLGLIAAVGLFVSVVIHELGHSVVGRAYGMEITHITLWILGGMAHFKKISRRPGPEAVMAIAGPATSFVLAGACWILVAVVPKDLGAVQFVLSYLLWMNVVLATFNLLPALPLDGGRVLRSLLALRMSHVRATEIAAGISRVLAFLLMLVGFVSFNLFLVLIAFFVLMGGAGEAQLAAVREALKGLRVADVMTAEVKTVPQNLPVRDLLERMCDEKHLAYPVVDFSDQVVGLVTLRQIQDRGQMLPEASEELVVGDVMATEFGSVAPTDTALRAFERMQEEPMGRLIVFGAGRRLQGIISKTDLVQCVQVRLVERAMGAR